MAKFVICTDSGCDLRPEMLKEMGVEYAELTFRFEKEDAEYTNYGMPLGDFYDRMRKGGVAKTAAINSEIFIAKFTEILDTGADVLYLGFSSGLSTTFNSARLASLELAQRYPDRRIEVVDTLAASAGQGLLVYLVNEKKNAGATLDEAAAYAKELVPHISHWFTVDDLVYLKRGGRVSAATAIVGNLLGIKPVLHVDDDGHLINVLKARGRRNAVASLAAKYDELATEKAGTVFISHADCIEDAESLAGMLREKHGADIKCITDIGPVIGAHAGPGTLALFFVGDKK